MDEDDTLHTYTLGDGEDDALFIIENNQLKTSENSSFNFEEQIKLCDKNYYQR